MDTPPDRVVALDATAAAFLIELGAGDSIVGVSGTDFAMDYEGDLRATIDALPVLSERTATQEPVLAADPQLVTAVSDFSFGRFDGTATVETLEANGIAALSACGAAASGENTSLEGAYRYIEQLATALGVPEEGDELVSRFQQEMEQAAQAAEGAEPVPTLMLTSIPDGGTGVYTRGGSTYVNAIVSLAGGANLAANQPGDIVQLSAEQVVADDPQVIVAFSGLSGQSDEEFTAAIASSPLLAQTTAAREGHIVVVPSRIALSPSLLNPSAVEQIADAIARWR